MNTEKMKKLEYFTDIFKGTCEINNCNYIGVDVLDKGQPRTSQIGQIKNIIDTHLTNKLYFYGPVFEGEEERTEFGAMITGYDNTYRICDLINMANKILFNVGLYETTILVDTKDKQIVDNLDMTDQVAKIETLEKSEHDRDFAFEIIIEDRTVVHGGGSNGVFYFTIDYRAIEDWIDFDHQNTKDIYIMPKNAEVLEDTFAIATNLKDAGFKIEVDYELNGVEPDDVATDFLVTFDEKDIAKYVVHLKDLKTKEEREVMIDNLIEELSFI